MHQTILQHITISADDYRNLVGIAQKREIKRGEVIFYPNLPNLKMLFIEKGMLRGYRIIDGKEYTHHFYVEKWFATDFESFLTGKSSMLYIESLTNATYFEFKKEDLYTLYTSSHQLEKLGRIIAEKAFLATVEKLRDIQTLDLKDRYQHLIEKNPDLFQKVPQKYISSYLGVSEQSLSRIKNSGIS